MSAFTNNSWILCLKKCNKSAVINKYILYSTDRLRAQQAKDPGCRRDSPGCASLWLFVVCGSQLSAVIVWRKQRSVRRTWAQQLVCGWLQHKHPGCTGLRWEECFLGKGWVWLDKSQTQACDQMFWQKHNCCRALAGCWMGLCCGREHGPSKMAPCSLMMNHSCRSVCRACSLVRILSAVQ